MMQKLIISKELKKRLKKIDSDISRLLLSTKKVDDDLTGYINYLGISHDNRDFISYMTKDRINRYGTDFKSIEKTIDTWNNYYEIKLKKRYQLKTITGDVEHRGIRDFRVFISKESVTEDRPYLPWRSYNYIFVDNYGNIIKQEFCYYINTYFASKEEVNGFTYLENRDPLWDKNNRFHAKAGKTLRKLFNNKFTDKDWEQFSNLFKSAAISECGIYEYKELSGEEIRRAYLGESGAKGSIGNSCMRGHDCQSFFDLYCRNPRQISLATFSSKDNRIAARCLLWRGVENYEREVYFDRVYAVSGAVEKNMINHLISIGYIDIFKLKGGKDNFEIDYKIKIDVGEYELEKYPYMDSFRFITGNILCISSGNLELSDTSGHYNDYSDDSTCSACGDSVNEDNIYYIERGPSRGQDMCIDCSSYSEVYNEQIADIDSVYIKYLNTYILKEDAIKDYTGNYIYKDDVVELYNGEITRQGDDYLCQDKNGEWFLEGDENFEEVEGEWVNKLQLKLETNELQ